MEASLYDEEIMPTTSTSQSSSYDKGNLKLDFSSPNTRRQTSIEGTVLTSPDLNLLTLGSPELEKLIMSYGGILTTPTPGQLFKGTFSVTEQQEMYARGFMEALQRLHDQQGNESQNAAIAAVQSIPMSSIQSTVNMPFVTANGANSATNTVASATPVMCSATSTISTQSLPLVSLQSAGANQIFPDFQRNAACNFDPSTSLSQILSVQIPAQRLENIKVENEPQVVPGTPPLPPIDLALQETVKNERKKQRNRVAASKCRKRKLEKEADLQQKVDELKDINLKLHSEVSDLKKQVTNLKVQVMKHVHSGCEIMLLNQP
ncbi:transcription factor Jun-like [Montipora capricornis]|uniref:transcription factor Jun-like n=1 Tax=Montipora foliosa TaxID=591990 RepID=UPI0035F10835